MKVKNRIREILSLKNNQSPSTIFQKKKEVVILSTLKFEMVFLMELELKELIQIGNSRIQVQNR